MIMTIAAGAFVWFIADRPQGMPPHEAMGLKHAFEQAYDAKGEKVHVTIEPVDMRK